MHEHWRALSTRMLEWKNWEYEARVWEEWLRKKYQNPIYQMVSEVEKGGKNREKYSPVEPSWRSHAAAKKKIAKFQVSAEFTLFLPIEMWRRVHGQGMYTYIRAGVRPVFSTPSSSSSERLKCESKKPPTLKSLIDKNSTYFSKTFFNLLFVCSQLMAYTLSHRSYCYCKGHLQFYHNFNK